MDGCAWILGGDKKFKDECVIGFRAAMSGEANRLRMVAPKFKNSAAHFSAVGVAPCGDHSSSSSSSSSSSKRREEQEVALRHVLNKSDLERDVHRSTSHCLLPASVLLQCVCHQTPSLWMPIS
ncbi:uncharacterized protein V6R79_012113 [Siganus canaliculatus]